MCSVPASTQSSSAFLLLPLEIRISILENLVVVDEPVPITESAGRQHPKLSLAILRTCKQLHKEGITLLRQFNTPRMLCDLTHSGLWVTDWCTGRSGTVENIAYNSFLKDVVPQYATLHVVISSSLTSRDRSKLMDSLFATVSLLAKMDIKEKDLSIEFNQCIMEVLEIGNADADWIDVIGDIRCKRLSIDGVDNLGIARMIEMVEGRSGIPDLKSQCRDVLDHFSACQRLNLSSQKFSPDARLERDLRQSARISKLVEYKEVRSRILARCDELIEEFRVKHENFKAALVRTRRVTEPTAD